MVRRPLRTYAILGLFDPAGDAFIRMIWSQLSRTGIPCGIQEYRGARPHVTFSIFTGCGKDRAARIAASLAADNRPLRIELTHIGLFAVEGLSAYIGITSTRPLRELHRRIDTITCSCADELADYYRPGQWIPHCTLSSAIDKSQIPLIRRIGDELLLPRRFTLCALGLTELDHERQLWSYDRDFPFGG
jgi:2'-5' RNA ligase